MSRQDYGGVYLLIQAPTNYEVEALMLRASVSSMKTVITMTRELAMMFQQVCSTHRVQTTHDGN